MLLLPLSSHSTEILVADLGRLSITNKFLHAASEGTISKVCAEPEIDNGMFSIENLCFLTPRLRKNIIHHVFIPALSLAST